MEGTKESRCSRLNRADAHVDNTHRTFMGLLQRGPKLKGAGGRQPFLYLEIISNWLSLANKKLVFAKGFSLRKNPLWGAGFNSRTTVSTKWTLQNLWKLSHNVVRVFLFLFYFSYLRDLLHIYYGFRFCVLMEFLRFLKCVRLHFLYIVFDSSCLAVMAYSN